MITINDNIIYRTYKEESFLDENYLFNEGMKEAIKLVHNKAESVAGNKDATINALWRPKRWEWSRKHKI